VSARLTTITGPFDGTDTTALLPDAKTIVSVAPALTVSVASVSGAKARDTVLVCPALTATEWSESAAGEMAYPGRACALTKYSPAGRLKNA
jgi:hypothetical protein